jgi:hypothetical protein
MTTFPTLAQFSTGAYGESHDHADEIANMPGPFVHALRINGRTRVSVWHHGREVRDESGAITSVDVTDIGSCDALDVDARAALEDRAQAVLSAIYNEQAA